MSILLRDPLRLDPSHSEHPSERVKSVQDKRFLTDANIADVFRTFKDIAPEEILLVTPAQSHFIAMAEDQDAASQLAEMMWEHKDIIFLPVNDASIKKGSEGRHWSLLTMLRTKEGNNATSFTAILFDSAQLPSHVRRARVLTHKLIGDLATLQIGQCASQANGYDCGIYVLIFTEILIQGYMSSTAWYTFRVAEEWPSQLRAVTPQQATHYRHTLRDIYQGVIPIQDRDSSVVHLDSPSVPNRIASTHTKMSYKVQMVGSERSETRLHPSYLRQARNGDSSSRIRFGVTRM